MLLSDIIITSPLSPPSPQTQREKLLARESLFEAELKDATEKNILEDTTEPGSGQRWGDLNWCDQPGLSPGCELSGQLASQEISAKSSTRTGSQCYRFISHSSVHSFFWTNYMFNNLISNCDKGTWKSLENKTRKINFLARWTKSSVLYLSIIITSRESSCVIVSMS